MNRSLIMIPRFRLLFLFNVYNQGNKEHIIAGMLDCLIITLFIIIRLEH